MASARVRAPKPWAIRTWRCRDPKMIQNAGTNSRLTSEVMRTRPLREPEFVAGRQGSGLCAMVVAKAVCGTKQFQAKAGCQAAGQALLGRSGCECDRGDPNLVAPVQERAAGRNMRVRMCDGWCFGGWDAAIGACFGCWWSSAAQGRKKAVPVEEEKHGGLAEGNGGADKKQKV